LLAAENLPAENTDTMTLQSSSTQLTPLQSSGSVIKIDIDSVIEQLLAVKDTPGKQVFDCLALFVRI